MRSVTNALRVLDELAAAGPLGVGELARRTGIAKSTAQRCLETLAAAGWIELAFDGGPGAVTMWSISDRVRRRLGDRPTDLVAIAEPVLEDLTRATGEATHLVTLEGPEVVLRARIPGPGPVQIVLPVGYTVPAHAAATGKAMLALLEPEEWRARIPADPAGLTDATITDTRRLADELAEVRARGWATNAGEWHAQVAAVAAPVVVDGRPVAAVSVSTTPDRLGPERIVDVGAQVVSAAAAIARRL